MANFYITCKTLSFCKFSNLVKYILIEFRTICLVNKELD